MFCLHPFISCMSIDQERLASKDQKISENFYVRGDGTVSCDWHEEFYC